MKKIILVLILLSVSNGFSQKDNFFDFGIVAGFNYGSNGDYKADFTSENLSSDNKMGHHGGFYLDFNFKKVYLRPEIIYTKTKSNYSNTDFDVSKIDVPVLIGFKIFRPLSAFFGPSFQYTLDVALEDVDTDLIEIENDFAVNGQFGLALKLGKQIRLDAKYEMGISDNISTITNSSFDVRTIDTKPNQLILSLSLQL